MTSSADYDVAIAGGGMIGSALAHALSGLPLRVALAEAVPLESTAQPSFDERTVALSRSSRRILTALGLWEEVGGQASAIRRIHVSERGRFGSTVIDGEAEGVGDLGYVVPSRALGAALWDRLGRARNVELFCPGVIGTPQPAADRITVSVAGASGCRELRARLLVVADGARSRLRRELGIMAPERSYGQTALVGSVAASEAQRRDTAYERFTPDGPLALLPGPQGRFVFIMAWRTAAAEAALALGDAPFLALLQRSFGHRLGIFSEPGRRSAYPLALVRAVRTTAPRAVLIGNAAHGLHPVAGQGYNLGLRDVATLAEVIADALREGADIGATAALERYAGWRRRDQARVVAFTDGLVRLFDLAPAPLGAMRGIGLALCDVVPGAKRALARRTMGLGGTLTRLARGLPL